MKLRPGTLVCLGIDLVLLFLCVRNVPSLLERGRAPFDVTQAGDRVVVESLVDRGAADGLLPGDRVVTWDSLAVVDHSSIEFLADITPREHPVHVRYVRGGEVSYASIRLIPMNSLDYVFIVLLIGVLTYAVGIFVLVVRQSDTTAAVVHWAMVALGTTVIVTWSYAPPASAWSYVTWVLHATAYIATVSLFLFLTELFPRRNPGSLAIKAMLIFLPGVVVVGLKLFIQLRALYFRSTLEFARSHVLEDIFHVVLLLYIAAGIANFVRSYLHAESTVEQKKLKWLLWAFFVGPIPFLALITIPEFFVAAGPVPEQYALLPLLVIPVAFAVALLRYHILDVDVVINRTTVYAIVIGGLVVVYLLLVGAAAFLVGTYSVGMYAVAAVLIGLIAEPVRIRVQRLVDRRFFRVRYNYREAERRIIERIRLQPGEESLAASIIEEVDGLIPVERIGFFTLRKAPGRLWLAAHRNFDVLERRGVHFDAEQVKTDLLNPVALVGCIEPGIPYAPADAEVYHRWGIALAIPVLSKSGTALGFLVLGPRRSGARFTAEDMDLLANVTVETGLALERFRLQRDLEHQSAETRRLEELSDMKTEFMDYSVHELKQPLTALGMSIDRLAGRWGAVKGRSGRELRWIEGQYRRLGRMVSTYQDGIKIAHGLKQYTLSETDLGSIAARALAEMKLELETFTVRRRFPKRAVPIHADPEAIGQAITNLIGNSIKYSGDRRHIEVAVLTSRDHALCRVSDKGLGISAETLKHIFERFYRDPEVSGRVKGIGLGLPLVKHVMDAHGGVINVESTPGKGSTFTLVFPLATHASRAKAAGRRRRPIHH